MRKKCFATLVSAGLAVLLARSAAAEEPVQPLAPPPPPAATVDRAPPSVAPSGSDAGGVRELRERLFAVEGLFVDDRDRVVKDHQPLAPGDVYRLVGRPDLADRVHYRKVTKTVLVTCGLVGMAVGALAAIPALDGQQHDQTPAGVFFLTGAAATIGGIVLSSDPVSHDERARVIQSYNQRLRTSMGLAGAAAAAWQTAGISAVATPDGQAGMLTAHGSF